MTTLLDVLLAIAGYLFVGVLLAELTMCFQRYITEKAPEADPGPPLRPAGYVVLMVLWPLVLRVAWRRRGGGRG